MFLLDTDHCIYIMNGKPAGVAECAKRVGEAYLALSPFTIAELMYGACKSQHKERNLASISMLCKSLVTLPFEASVVRIFGEVKAALTAVGQLHVANAADARLKRDFDIAIAATAIAYGRTLVTHNTAHYAEIDGLTLDDWHD